MPYSSMCNGSLLRRKKIKKMAVSGGNLRNMKKKLKLKSFSCRLLSCLMEPPYKWGS